MNTRTLIAVSLLLAAAGLSAQTSPKVIGLYNTGITVGGLSPYTLVSAPVVPGTAFHLYEPNPAAWPINGPWLDNVTSGANAVQWLGVYSGATVPRRSANVPTVAAGDYTIRLNFDLGTFDPATVGFTIHAAADNRLAVRLNGFVLPNYGTATGDVNYSSLASYSYTVAGLASGLKAGANWIDFVVTNVAGAGNNPAGLYVTFSDLTITVVPEPSTYALFLAVLTVAFVLWRRHRRRNKDALGSIAALSRPPLRNRA